MRPGFNDFFFYLGLFLQALIGILLLRFISLWLGYDAYVPFIDDLYMFLIDLLEAIARGGSGLLPGASAP